ncbi:MAG: ABC transporter permease [Acidimicrobiales bacterium]
MSRQLRAELFKLRTTAGAWIVLLVTLLLTALGIVLSFLVPHGATVSFGAPRSVQDLRDLVGAGYTAGTVMAPVLGVLAITTEHRHRVLTATLLLEPRRSRVLAAKVAACVLWGLFMCVASLALVAAMGIPLLTSQGGSLPDLAHQIGPVVPGLLGAYALLAVYGLGIGVLVRNQIAGVIVALGVSLVLEPIVVAIFRALLHWDINWLPSRATQAVAGGLTGGQAAAATIGNVLLTWWLGALALVAWGIGLAVVGYFTTFRRDVT